MCPACETAATNPRTGRINPKCRECCARDLANSPMAFRALKGEPDELRERIEAIWKEDYAAGRAAVWRWIELIQQAPK